jgi:MFS family permease
VSPGAGGSSSSSSSSSSPASARLDLRRAELERHAAVLFAASALVMAVVCGSVIVSGWFAGVLVDRWERLFWVGALLGGLMVAVFAAAAMPGGADARRSVLRITWLLRAGLLLVVLAPALCVVALVGDFYRL